MSKASELLRANRDKVMSMTIEMRGPSIRAIKRELQQYKRSLEDEGKTREEIGKLLCSRLKEIKETIDF